MAAETTSLSNEMNLETFSLVCLGVFVSKEEESINAEKQLRASINHLNIFVDIDQCEQHIQSLSKDDRIVLIVNEQMGRTIVPRVHHLLHVIRIYVHCGDYEQNEEWIEQYPKVSHILIEIFF